MRFLTPVWNYVDALVHPMARHDALTAARHRAFIAPRLLGSLAALASFPVYLAFRGVPSALEAGVFAWLVAPILIAYFLSRTGRYQSAHVLSSLALTGLVTVVAWRTGGIASFAAIWLVVVPLEAALSASRRVVALASTIALAAAGLLLAVSAIGLLPPPLTAATQHGALAALGIISAALYAIGLALGAEQLARTSHWLLYVEEDRYRLLARNMTDVITRHGRNGAVLFVSPAAEPLFGVAPSALAGHGMFERVHVADRPAYLTALADAAARTRTARSNSVSAAAATSTVKVLNWPGTSFGRDSVPPARPVEHAGRRTRSGRGAARHQRAKDAGTRARDCARELAARQRRQIPFPRHHEPRTADAAQRHHRLLRSAHQRSIRPMVANERHADQRPAGRHLLALVNGVLDMTKLDAGN